MTLNPDDLDACLRVLQTVSEDPSGMAGHDRFKALVAKVHRRGKKGQVLRRRAAGRADVLLRWGELQIDPARRTVTRAGQPVELSAREFGVLRRFVHA